MVTIGVIMLRFHCTVYMYTSKKNATNLPDTVKVPRIKNSFNIFDVFFLNFK